MGAGPSENARNLIPIGHFFELVGFNRSSRHYHSIELLMTHSLKITIEHHHVLNRRILGGMTLELHETDIQLQWGVGQQTDQVCLCGYLQGHEIQDDNLQGTNVLGRCPRVIHYKYILTLKYLYCW